MENYIRSDYSKRKPLWRWQASGDKNFKYVIHLFWPYMGERRRAKVLEIMELRNEFNTFLRVGTGNRRRIAA